ncbi:SDR family NAD(P)-dependent oxidoreductase [Cylindrospermum sp. FACHB-282]|uniref:SDR family NAD(P)-dependent oxidoreductase n=1 Tax=Cylindrospermum sp. FACHB-282 TaxID=2692794 RepID=UPI0018F04604|nr:SDR family NAD(P)-dependent oxidoreductase [Cylindrospermum sp. FACHB-282]
MDLKLDGKSALVSGSTAGIGFAVAQALAQEGVSTIINSRTEARVAQAIAKIQKLNK